MKVIGDFSTYKTPTRTINNSHTRAENCYNNVINQKTPLFPNASLIYFKGINNQIHTPFLKSTANRLDRVYKRYKAELNEIPPEEIKKISVNLQKELNLPSETVLEAMTELTQFSSIKSVPIIGKYLTKNKVTSIGNYGNRLLFNPVLKNEYANNKTLRNALLNDNGINKTLSYLLNEKGIHCITNTVNRKIAIFLDETRITCYENLKKENPELLDKILKIPNLKFFIISGWDSGIPFINRTKDLESETRELLKKSIKTGLPPKDIIDYDNIKRCNELGIKDIILIKNPSNKTEQNVYQNMAPLKMTKKELFDIVDANSQVRTKGDNNLLISKDICSKFLDNSLTVYTPEKISKDLKLMHKKITDYAKICKVSEDNINYVLLENIKSYDYITYSYQKINNIPDKNIITVDDLFIDPNCSKDKMLVFLDDCAISGASITYVITTDIDKRTLRNANSIVFACIDGTKEAKDCFNPINRNNYKYKLILLNTNTKTAKGADKKELSYKTLGSGIYDDGKYCHIFPYMSPDNDCEFASNIALLHNVNYRNSQKDLNSVFYRAIKTTSNTMHDVIECFNKLSKIKDSNKIIDKK